MNILVQQLINLFTTFSGLGEVLHSRVLITLILANVPRSQDGGMEIQTARFIILWCSQFGQHFCKDVAIFYQSWSSRRTDTVPRSRERSPFSRHCSVFDDFLNHIAEIVKVKVISTSCAPYCKQCTMTLYFLAKCLE